MIFIGPVNALQDTASTTGSLLDAATYSTSYMKARPADEVAVIPENPVLSHIYRVLQVRQKKNDNGKTEEIITEHANLDGYASFEIKYENPPEEWKDADIRPYYYDDIFVHKWDYNVFKTNVLAVPMFALIYNIIFRFFIFHIG